MCCPQMLLTAETNGDIHTNDDHQSISNEVGLLIWAILQMSILLSKKNQVMNRECGLRVYGVCVCVCLCVMISFFLSLFSSFVCLSVCLLSQVSHIELLLYFQSWPQILPRVALNFWSACRHFSSVWIIVVLCPVSWHVLMCVLWYVHICAHLCGSQKTTSWSFFKNLLSLFLFWVGWYWIFVCFVLDRVPECPEPCHVGKDGWPVGILGKYSTNWATTLAQIHCNLYIWRVFCWKNPLEIDNGCL